MVLIADLARRLVAHIGGVCRSVADRAAGTGAGADTGTGDALLAWARARLDRGSAGVRVLLARLAAGEVIAAPAHPARSGRSAVGPRRRANAVAGSRKRGWLSALLADGSAHGADLRALIADPEMTALLAAAPSVGRLLRSMWRMLNLDAPPEVLRVQRLSVAAGVSAQATWSDLQAAFDAAAAGTRQSVARLDAAGAQPASAFEDACGAMLRSIQQMEALAVAMVDRLADPPARA